MQIFADPKVNWSRNLYLFIYYEYHTRGIHKKQKGKRIAII